MEYNELDSEEHLVLLEALMWAVADSEVFREHLQDDGPDTINELLPRGDAVGSDDSGALYYRLGSHPGEEQCCCNRTRSICPLARPTFQIDMP